jgi:hypothetical protein
VKTAEGKLIGMNAHLGTVTLKFQYRVLGMTKINDEELKVLTQAIEERNRGLTEKLVLMKSKESDEVIKENQNPPFVTD